jgi:hypothetical protein
VPHVQQALLPLPLLLHHCLLAAAALLQSCQEAVVLLVPAAAAAGLQATELPQQLVPLLPTAAAQELHRTPPQAPLPRLQLHQLLICSQCCPAHCFHCQQMQLHLQHQQTHQAAPAPAAAAPHQADPALATPHHQQY